MASSFLSLANNHLADWGSTLAGRDGEEEVKREEEVWKSVIVYFSPSPYVENEQEARDWYGQLQAPPIPYEVRDARQQHVAQPKCIVSDDASEHALLSARPLGALKKEGRVLGKRSEGKEDEEGRSCDEGWTKDGVLWAMGKIRFVLGLGKEQQYLSRKCVQEWE